MTKLRFEYDPDKSALNRERHGIDFGAAQRIWGVAGEERFSALGKINGKIYQAVFAKRHEAIRLISCHRADREREKIYERPIEKESS